MGDYRITIDAVGGHGCARETKSGERPYRCRRDDCVDCQVGRFVEQLARRGSGSLRARLEHWPRERIVGLSRVINENPGPIDHMEVDGTGVFVEQRIGSFADTPYLAHANDTAGAAPA